MKRPAPRDLWFAVAVLAALALSVASVYHYLTEPPENQGVIEDR